MTISSSQNTLNNFHRLAQDIQSDYINPRIIRKLRALNATLTLKSHTFRATRPGYYVEWFYNVHTRTFTMISGATNGMVYMEDGDLDTVCDRLGQMFGYDV
jgi:hypothetical protein